MALYKCIYLLTYLLTRCDISRTVKDWSYCWVLIGSHICRVDWHNNRWPCVTSNGRFRIARYLCGSWASCFPRFWCRIPCCSKRSPIVVSGLVAFPDRRTADAGSVCSSKLREDSKICFNADCRLQTEHSSPTLHMEKRQFCWAGICLYI